MSTPLATRVDLTARLQLHALALIAGLFLAIYGRLVCPFIDGLRWGPLLGGLLFVALVQIALRELAYRYWQPPGSHSNPARHGYHIALLTWGAAGLVGLLTHSQLYPDFPLGSHLKLLVGYLGLGGGLLAYLEYAHLERRLRREEVLAADRRERLTRRLLESFTLFTLIPGLALTLMVLRMHHEGYVSGGVVFELLFLTLFFMGIAQAVAWYWGQTLREDTAQIIAGLEQVRGGVYHQPLRVPRADELGEVALGINQMAQGLAQRERIRDAFGRFVSPQVAERFIRDHVSGDKALRLGGERHQVTVLMCDLRDFTPLAERLEPEQLTAQLNAYFAQMVAAIAAHGGMVDKFIGDAVMAVFGLDDAEGPAADQALAAALAMRARLATLNAERAAQGEPPLDNGIGLHSGEVVAGYMGSPERLEFTVIGHTVNLAARIEAACKAPNPPLLLSPATRAALQGAPELQSIGAVALKGVAQPLELFTPRAGVALALHPG